MQSGRNTLSVTQEAASQLNWVVRPYLERFVVGDYTLSEEGATIVFDSNEQLKESYAEAHNFKPSAYWHRLLKEKLLQLSPNEFGVVLDVCCGTGLLCLNMMKYRMFRECYAIDINESSLEYLKKKMRSENIRGIKPIFANIMDTKFDANFFDCVMGNSFLHHIPDNPSFFREVLRILKPGGTVCLTHEPSVSACRLEELIIDKLLKVWSLLRDAGRRKGRESNTKKTTPIFSDIWQYNESKVCRMLRDVGFDEVQITAQGRIATVLGSFIERQWFRRFKKMPPVAVLSIRSMLNWLDKMLFRNYSKNSFSSFTISARKPTGL